MNDDEFRQLSEVLGRYVNSILNDGEVVWALVTKKGEHTIITSNLEERTSPFLAEVARVTDGERMTPMEGDDAQEPNA